MNTSLTQIDEARRKAVEQIRLAEQHINIMVDPAEQAELGITPDRDFHIRVLRLAHDYSKLKAQIKQMKEEIKQMKEEALDAARERDTLE